MRFPFVVLSKLSLQVAMKFGAHLCPQDKLKIVVLSGQNLSNIVMYDQKPAKLVEIPSVSVVLCAN